MDVILFYSCCLKKELISRQEISMGRQPCILLPGEAMRLWFSY